MERGVRVRFVAGKMYTRTHVTAVFLQHDDLLVRERPLRECFGFFGFFFSSFRLFRCFDYSAAVYNNPGNCPVQHSAGSAELVLDWDRVPCQTNLIFIFIYFVVAPVPAHSAGNRKFNYKRRVRAARVCLVFTKLARKRGKKKK